MNDIRIVGLVLVRNEDVFVKTAVRNILSFCDLVIIADHASTDDTWAVVNDLAETFSHISVHRIADPGESHSLVQEYAGKNCWVFAVDGDEIFDPQGLSWMRRRIMEGEFDEWWQVFGNVLNCTQIDYQALTARGYLAPPCRSITKLFNFSAIESWNGPCPERLHGGHIKFRPGYDGNSRLNLQQTYTWNESEFRCLHTCFMRRSSRDTDRRSVRKNIAEKNAAYSSILAQYFGLLFRRTYKRNKYMRGPIVECDVGSILNPRRDIESPA